ncbi:hypothetical protein O181_061715 [Austropuccinia psidii MF-1]|uniref:Uncharacterized protein n=1 Tax=Austropuccinia psidii MF-1 TaxID=1389203 RepID=A0A9Q3EFQ0_9BASI|nr:hypothetical protein [Austropuccinia psidii MF-1]
MIPSPAHTTPPPSQLAWLLNPTPNPPDKYDHIIIPKIYKNKPGFLIQTQNYNQSKILTIIPQKMKNLKRKEANMTLSTAIETLIMQLNNRIDDLTEKQFKMDKLIDYLLAKINNCRKKQITNSLVNTPASNNLPPVTIPLSFAEAMANT